MFSKSLLSLAITLMIVCGTIAAEKQPNTLSGRIIDASTGNPTGYATVVLMRDSTAVAAVAAEADGSFTLKVPTPGTYSLQVTMVGYTPYAEPVEIPSAGRQLEKVAITPGVGMDEVVVSAQKPLVVSDAEKTTYSVEDDPQASTSTLEEIIRKVPQLSLDADGNVLLNGQSNYKILLNGQSATSLSNNFKEVIRSMPASQISRIEVITNPSTKYEAEGVGGIINLVTQKKKQFHGYNGSISAGITALENRSYYTSANVSLQSGKFAAGARVYFNYYDGTPTPSVSQSWHENFNSENRYTSTSNKSSFTSRNIGTNLDFSYQPDTLNLITLSGWVWNGRSRRESQGFNAILDSHQNELMGYSDNGFSQWDYTGGSIAVNYEHNFGREGHTLTVSDEMEIDPDSGDARSLYQGGYNMDTRNKENNRSTSNTVQIDYANQLSEHHNIEAGVKHIYRNNNTSTLITENSIDDDAPSQEATRTLTKMDYRQHVLGIYAGYGFSYTKWSGRLGARMERTWNDADVDETDVESYSFANRQFNVVPYASLTFKPAKSQSLSLTYTQRLQRPSIYMLSPAVNNTDPSFRDYGNPGLEAAVFNSFTLQYNYFSTRWSKTFGLNTSFSDNSMSSYSFADEQGVHNSTYSNAVHTRSFGFNGSLSYRAKSGKLSVSLSYGGTYAKYDFAAMEINTDRFSFRENLNVDITVWKAGRVTLGQNYSSGHASLGSRSQSYYSYYIGLKQQFFKKKLDVGITCSNPFNKYRDYKQISKTPTYEGWNLYRNPFRSLSFNLSWRFGKQGISVKQTERSISNDDISGGGKGGGGGGEQ